MARNPKVGKKASGGKPRPAEGRGRPRRGRQKVCRFCAEHTVWVDYKDVNLLRRFMNDRGRIRSRGATGTCAQHQRDVAVAIKTARELALLPYAVRTVAGDPGAGRSRGRRDQPGVRTSGEAAGPPGGADTETAAGDGEADDAVDPDTVDDTGEATETTAATGSEPAGNDTEVGIS
jgi:small subunit ribosomal protein S18